jgi:hypothetical protein
LTQLYSPGHGHFLTSLFRLFIGHFHLRNCVS